MRKIFSFGLMIAAALAQTAPPAKSDGHNSAARFEAVGKHLKLTATASKEHVRTGDRIALTLDIQLPPRLHVYAPGVSSEYIPIDWSMNESPAVAVQPAVYPKSKMLHLEVINETVPVYDDTLRLVRYVTIAPDSDVRPLLDAEGKLTIEGILKYQACDTSMCYIPDKVPVRWTLIVDESQRKGR